ncbi:EamA family transporter [Chitiniphilus purpureus]|uniref:EamA family transporter n=1 Tax=Chitiniphilus purpureus TaxID=2981137 RepID=A0ABY6DSB2_9NEIS|nr:EamA family transporter [Chitiniphilus sp. CD1]UXY15966.1 EamA family transporter [Chitiniphilus sp. CD1]
MHLLAALVLVMIWSTTALAIRWSVDGMAYASALFGRFVLAAMFTVALVVLLRQRVPLRRALPAWLIGGVATAISMLCTYWAARHVPSGLLAVLFGLGPLTTALFARLWLQQRLAGHEWIGIVLGLAGTAVIFGERLQLAPGSGPALAVLLAAVSIQSAAAVRLKGAAQGLPALTVNAGALLVCALLSGLWWLAQGAPAPAAATPRALVAVLYLALVGSALAFSLYYWLIRECAPGQVALLSLVSPVCALWLGKVANGEVLSLRMLTGTVLILGGLLLHQRHGWRRLLRR